MIAKILFKINSSTTILLFQFDFGSNWTLFINDLAKIVQQLMGPSMHDFDTLKMSAIRFTFPYMSSINNDEDHDIFHPFLMKIW